MVRNPLSPILRRFNGWFEKKAYRAMQKYGEVPIGHGAYGMYGEVEPPYQRRFNPTWIYQIRQNNGIINNCIEEKVNQTFRRGWGEWEKRYEAKCPECHEEFGSQAPFVEDFHPEDVDIDFESERECPECGEMVDLITPDPDNLQKAKDFIEQANGVYLDDDFLEPDAAASVSQTLMEVFREGTWDLESFDDEWFTLTRSYKLDNSGRIKDYCLEEVYRAPPEKMKYIVDKQTGAFGGKYWVCIECREKHGEDYMPETTPDARCSDCGNKTHEVYAVATKGRNSGGDPIKYFIRGEFIHRSLYEPSKHYGFSPIVSLWEEARTLEQMDSWYQEAYEQRRAPRGAIALRSSNSQSTMEWNKKQFEKLKSDPNHIPTLIDDSDEGGGEPISFISLLESPAEMQHMEMREWFKERISAKWGVTPIFQGSPSESGLSQSMELEVSARAAERVREVQNDILDVIIRQLGVEGWQLKIAPVEEENEQEEVELRLKHLQAAQQAASMGREVEWTEDQRAHIKPGDIEEPEQGGEMGMGGMDGLGEMDSDMEETAADEGGPEDQDDVQTATESAGGDRVDLGSTGSGAGQ